MPVKLLNKGERKIQFGPDSEKDILLPGKGGTFNDELATRLKKCFQDEIVDLDDVTKDFHDAANAGGGEESKPYAEMALKELKAEMKSRELEIPKGSKEGDLIALLEADDAANAGGGEEEQE